MTLPEFTVEIPATLESPIPAECLTFKAPTSYFYSKRIQTPTPPPTQTSPSTPIVSSPSTHQLPSHPRWLQSAIHHQTLNFMSIQLVLLPIKAEHACHNSHFTHVTLPCYALLCNHKTYYNKRSSCSSKVERSNGI